MNTTSNNPQAASNSSRSQQQATSADHALYEQQHHPASAPPPGNFYGYPPHPPPYLYAPPPPPPTSSGLSTAVATSLITVGGVLGLSAAAAYRWLNGDEFQILPASTHRMPRESAVSSSSFMADDLHGSRTAAAASILETRRLIEQNSLLAEQVESLVKALASQSQQQEKLMARILQHDDSRTDQSMELLRAQKEAAQTKESMLKCLAEISNDLNELKKGVKNGLSGRDKEEAWEAKLTRTMDQVKDAVNSLEESSGNEKKPVTMKTTTKQSAGKNDRSIAKPMTDIMASSIDDSLRVELARAVYRLAKENTKEDLEIGAGILFLYVSNLSNYPKVPRYRKIYTCNEGFQKVDNLVGGREFLLTIGFSDGGSVLDWMSGVDGAPSPSEESAYLSLLSDAVAALNVIIKDINIQSNDDLAKDAVAAIALPFPDQFGIIHASSHDEMNKTNGGVDAPAGKQISQNGNSN